MLLSVPLKTVSHWFQLQSFIHRQQVQKIRHGERNPSEWVSWDPKDLDLEVAKPKITASGVWLLC